MNRRQSLSVRVANLVALCATASCVDKVPLGLSGGDCPCAEGFTCDTETMICVPMVSVDGGTGGGGGGTGTEGFKWSVVPAETARGLNAVWGSGPDDVWAVGQGGTVLHWDGTGWSKAAGGVTALDRNIVGGSGRSAAWSMGNAEAYGADFFMRWDGTTWSGETNLAPRGPNNYSDQGAFWYGIWAASADQMWIVGGARYSSRQAPRNAGIGHWDGSAWSKTMTPLGVSSPGDDRSVPPLRAVWGSGPNDVWAVGDAGAVVRWDGTAWSRIPSATSETLSGIWGSGPNDIWAVGSDGTVLRWNGTVWSSVSSGSTKALAAVWGGGPDDVWAVGQGGTILRWNGTNWSQVSSGTTVALRGVWGSAVWGRGMLVMQVIWAVGDGGTILRYGP